MSPFAAAGACLSPEVAQAEPRWRERLRLRPRRVAQYAPHSNLLACFHAGGNRPHIDPARKNEIRELILRFEDLMIEELIDWIHISRNDAIEVAP
jgi:hypothetical protein